MQIYARFPTGNFELFPFLLVLYYEHKNVKRDQDCTFLFEEYKSSKIKGTSEKT